MQFNTNQSIELDSQTKTNPQPEPAPGQNTERISFFVPGIAKPAGSKKAFMRKGMRFPVIVDDCTKSRDWKTTVSQWAQGEINRLFGPGFKLWDGPLKFDVVIHVLRPKGHLNSKGAVKASAPKHPVVRPDVLKLTRGIEDALSGIVWVDDSQIVDEHIKKVYADKPGAELVITKL